MRVSIEKLTSNKDAEIHIIADVVIFVIIKLVKI